jgi:hypothetical protein
MGTRQGFTSYNTRSLCSSTARYPNLGTACRFGTVRQRFGTARQRSGTVQKRCDVVRERCGSVDAPALRPVGQRAGVILPQQGGEKPQSHPNFIPIQHLEDAGSDSYQIPNPKP